MTAFATFFFTAGLEVEAGLAFVALAGFDFLETFALALAFALEGLDVFVFVVVELDGALPTAPPKANSQPEAYFSFVPTRIIDI